MTVTLADRLKDSAYRLDQFKPEHIAIEDSETALAHLAAANPPMAAV